MNCVLHLVSLENLYGDRDVSHGVEHIERVHHTVHMLAQILKVAPTVERDACAVAIMHDRMDYKYTSGHPSEDPEIVALGGNIADIVAEVSFSHERDMRISGNKCILSPHDARVLDIVRDADRLDSIGAHAVLRMVKYKVDVFGMPPSELVPEIHQYANMKLYRLVIENYIVTEPARMLAEPLIESLRDILNDEVKLQTAISEALVVR